MGLEAPTVTRLDELNDAWPLNTDLRSEGDDHLRVIKRVLKTTFPNLNGVVTATLAQVNRTSILGSYGGILGTSAVDTGNLTDITTYGSSTTFATTDISVNASSGIMTINTTGTYLFHYASSFISDIDVAAQLFLYNNTTAIAASGLSQLAVAATSTLISGSFLYAATATNPIRLRLQHVGANITYLNTRLLATRVI